MRWHDLVGRLHVNDDYCFFLAQRLLCFGVPHLQLCKCRRGLRQNRAFVRVHLDGIVDANFLVNWGKVTGTWHHQCDRVGGALIARNKLRCGFRRYERPAIGIRGARLQHKAGSNLPRRLKRHTKFVLWFKLVPVFV